MSFRQSFHGEATRNLTSKSKSQVTLRRQKKRFSRRCRSSTVVFGFAFKIECSSRKASIKEFHQLALLPVTIPLRMTGGEPHIASLLTVIPNGSYHNGRPPSLSFRTNEVRRNLTSKSKSLVTKRRQKSPKNRIDK